MQGKYIVEPLTVSPVVPAIMSAEVQLYGGTPEGFGLLTVPKICVAVFPSSWVNVIVGSVLTDTPSCTENDDPVVELLKLRVPAIFVPETVKPPLLAEIVYRQLLLLVDCVQFLEFTTNVPPVTVTALPLKEYVPEPMSPTLSAMENCPVELSVKVKLVGEGAVVLA